MLPTVAAKTSETGTFSSAEWRPKKCLTSSFVSVWNKNMEQETFPIWQANPELSHPQSALRLNAMT